MSEDKDDDKVRTRFDDLEKQIVTDGFNPGVKPDFLTQRNKKHRMRGLDSPTVLSGQDSVPAVVPPSVLRASALTVVYLVVLAGFAWTGWHATVGYLGTHGQGMGGRVVVSKCADGSWYSPGTRCSGFFVPTDAQQLRQGVAVTDSVTTLGAGSSSAGKQVHGQLLSVSGNTVYTSGWTGWIWYGVAALVLLALLVFLTFRRRGVVPGIRATLSARGARKARVHAQEQAKERARALRKKRAAEARARNASQSQQSDADVPADADAPLPTDTDTTADAASEPSVEADSTGTDTADTGATSATAAAASAEQPEEKTGGKTRKVLKPRPPAKRSGRAGGTTSPAHVGTATGTTKTVGSDDLSEPDTEDEHRAPDTVDETKSEGD